MAEFWEQDQVAQPQGGGNFWDGDKVEQPAAPEQEAVPEAFLDRVRAGQALDRVMTKASAGWKEGTDGTTPTGFSDKTLDELIGAGIFHDPAKGRGGPIQMLNEGVMLPLAQAWQGITSGLSGGLHATGGAVGQIVDEFGGEGGRAEREVINAGNWAMIEAGFGRFQRTKVSPAGPQDQVVGGLPRPEDFSTAATVIDPPPTGAVRFFHGGDEPTTGGGRWVTPDPEYARNFRSDGVPKNVHYVDIPKGDPAEIAARRWDEQLDAGTNMVGRYGHIELPEHWAMQLKPFAVDANIRALWQERGIHPAEAVADAQADAFLKHDLMTKGEKAEAPADLVEMGAAPRDLGAAVNTEPPLVPLSQQPASSPGSLLAAGRDTIDQLLGMGRNLQFMLDPMATGSNRSMVIAKDAINSVRRIRWDSARIIEDIEARLKPEQWERLWNAADEESVARQLGESREHQGLATLEPHERAVVDRLHADAQNAWLHAIDVGIVEGEGLPAYTPRMVMNVAAMSDHAGPVALNELGRNVFTRTAQMRHRGFMTAEETESAAKRLVGQRMAERGASADEINAAMEKVKIARDIRALPIATAKLQEATVWREMINKIEDTGKAAGQDTVAVGYKPDSSWFTIAGNPAFTKWAPDLVKNVETGKFEPRLDASGHPIMVPKPVYMPDEFKGPMSAILDPARSRLEKAAMSPYEALMAIKGKSMQAILNSPLIHNEVVWSKVMEAAGGREWLGFGLYWKGNKIVNGVGPRASELIERGLNPMGARGSIQDITAMMEEPTLKAGRSITAKVLSYVPGLFDAGAEVAVKRAIDKAGDFYHNTLLWDRVRDVQFGLADHLSDKLVAKGADRLTADRIASHFSNIIVGSIPKEAMSSAARATANMLLFSRSFTLGNLSTFKQAALGLPKPILAQIERDYFGRTGILDAPEAVLGSEAAAMVKQDAQSIARRKAASTILMSAGLYYVGNALVQHGFNIAARDSSLEEEVQGYARRYKDLMEAASKDPFELRHSIGRLSPTYDNEPAKQDRAHIGYDKDGTAIYARNPTGKFGEEMIGYPTMPLEMVRRKLSPMAGGLLDVLTNDKGFGRKIYNEKDSTLGGDAATAFAVAKHLVMKHLPEGQITAGFDLLRGDGDKTVNSLRLFGPMLGFTASVGAPGGPARGEQMAVKGEFDAKFSLAWPDIRKQIQRGDVEGARAAMVNIGVPPQMQNGLIRNANNPAGSLKGKTLRDFYQMATPEQRERMERARQ